MTLVQYSKQLVRTPDDELVICYPPIFVIVHPDWYGRTCPALHTQIRNISVDNIKDLPFETASLPFKLGDPECKKVLCKLDCVVE